MGDVLLLEVNAVAAVKSVAVWPPAVREVACAPAAGRRPAIQGKFLTAGGGKFYVRGVTRRASRRALEGRSNVR